MRTFRSILVLVIALATAACSTAATSTPGATSSPSAPSATSAQSATSAPATQSAPAASSSATFRPTFQSVPCPDDVSVQILQPPSCGRLTVLEDRSHPDGRQIQLLVVRVDPPGGTSTPDPVVVVGDSLAAEIEYGGTAVVGQRTHRVAYIVDLRGIAHSVPNLDCPEVRNVGPTLLGLRQEDPAYGAAFLKAVQACHDRLTGTGIDLAAYDIAASAADVEDLRIALQIPAWNVVAYGNATRVAVEIGRRYPDHVRTVVLDSPLLPGADPFSSAATSTRDAIGRVVAACAADSTCNSQSPTLGASIDGAIARLDARPITVTAVAPTGRSVRIVFDGATLVRALREMVGANDGYLVSAIPRTIGRALAGTLLGDDPAAVLMAADTAACIGFLPGCSRLDLGAAYSLTCRDFAMTAGTGGDTHAVGAGYAEAFGKSPFLATCAAWGVAANPAELLEAVETSPPTLMVSGVYDPYTESQADVKAALSAFPHGYLLEVPNVSYNALGWYDCPRQIRGAWMDSPGAAPVDTSCLATIPALKLTP